MLLIAGLHCVALLSIVSRQAIEQVPGKCEACSVPCQLISSGGRDFTRSSTALTCARNGSSWANGSAGAVAQALSGSGCASRNRPAGRRPFRPGRRYLGAAPAGGGAARVTALQGVGDIEDQRDIAAGPFHNAKAQHVHHQVVIAKIAAAPAQQDAVVAALGELFRDVGHLGRAEELGLLILMMAPVAAIASTRSVWRARKAGSCRMSQTSAVGAACSGVCVGYQWHAVGFTSARMDRPSSSPGPR